jgi:hypothetical protein
MTILNLKPYRIFEGDGMKMKFVAFDPGEYASDGFEILPASVGMEEIYSVFIQTPYTTHIKEAVWNPADSKVILYSDWAATEVVNTTDCSGEWVRCLIVGY